jgi:hypothetical protein
MELQRPDGPRLGLDVRGAINQVRGCDPPEVVAETDVEVVFVVVVVTIEVE